MQVLEASLQAAPQWVRQEHVTFTDTDDHTTQVPI